MDLDEMKRQGRCFRCGQQGHISRNCPNKEQKKFDVRATVQELSKDERVELLHALQEETASGTPSKASGSGQEMEKKKDF